MKNISLLFALLLGISGCHAEELLPSTLDLNNTQHVSNETLNEPSIQARGRALREELEKTYADADLIHASPAKGSEILRKVVVRYINTGTGFDYAEALLKNAIIGFDTDPEHVPSRKNEHHGNVAATLILQSFWLGGYAAVAIDLYPQRIDNITIIGRVDVNFFSFP